jgi:hypothetical protein
LTVRCNSQFFLRRFAAASGCGWRLWLWLRSAKRSDVLQPVVERAIGRSPGCFMELWPLSTWQRHRRRCEASAPPPAILTST